MTIDIDELIQQIDPNKMRAALEDRKEALQERLALLIVDWQLEENNAGTDAKSKKAILESIEKNLSMVKSALDEVNRRLTAADESLRGNGSKPNRAIRRSLKSVP